MQAEPHTLQSISQFRLPALGCGGDRALSRRAGARRINGDRAPHARRRYRCRLRTTRGTGDGQDAAQRATSRGGSGVKQTKRERVRAGMKSLIALGLLLAAAGCTTTTTTSTGKLVPEVPKQPSPSDIVTRARVHTELASGYYELGSYGVAIEEANEALKADPNFTAAYNVLGLVYMELRDDQTAEANFQR